MKRGLIVGASWLAVTASLSGGCQAGYVLRQGLHRLGGTGDEVPLDSPALGSKTSPEAGEMLRWVPRVLELARNELGLDPGDSYTTYVDTQGKPVSHAVTASHPLALIPYEWQFPFAGRVPYKGYFDEGDARREAERLRSSGLETLVVPIEAYSTLGWFRDPVVSSMLEGNTADLVDVILHETTHRTVYFPGHSSFNESLASYVAHQGTVLFLSTHEELKGLLPGYLADKREAAEREQVLLRLRNDLDALYRSALEDGVKERRKAEIFATASEAYRKLRRGSGKGSLPASNAFVLSVARYHELEPLFDALAPKLDPGSSRRAAALVAFLKNLPDGDDPVAAVKQALESPAAALP